MGTEKLIIMRHAKSEGASVTHKDFDRALSRRGVADATRMGQWLRATAHIPECIISSSAIRAKQTTKLVCAAAQIDIDKVYWERSVYATTTAHLLGLAHSYFQKEKRIMLVGHNPEMEGLLRYLTDENGYMSTANIAVFDLDKTKKRFLKKASCRLITIARPKEIR